MSDDNLCGECERNLAGVSSDIRQVHIAADGSLEDCMTAKAVVIAKIRALAVECGRDGWNGEGAVGITEDVANRAIKFVVALPDDLPLPDPAPDPDGEISLDWHGLTSRFSLSIGKSGDRYAYATRGVADFPRAVALLNATCHQVNRLTTTKEEP